MSGKNIYQRVAAAMEEVKYIQNEFKRGMQYRIVSHDAVTAKVRPVLLRHGVHYRPLSIRHEQVGNRTECHMVVRFTNIDNPYEDYFDVETLGYGVDSQDKGPGKAMSYAVKYALLKALGLETGEDADLDHQAEHDPAPPRDPSEPPKDWTASPERQIAPATHTGLEEALQKKGLAWEVVRKKFADKHGRMLPANSAEIPVAAVDKLRDLIKSAPNATKVDPEDADLSPAQKAKVEEMQDATDGKVKVMKRGDA